MMKPPTLRPNAALLVALLAGLAACGTDDTIDRSALWMPQKAAYLKILEPLADTESEAGYLTILLVEPSGARLASGHLEAADPTWQPALDHVERKLAELGLTTPERLFDSKSPEAYDEQRRLLIERRRVDIGDLNLFLVVGAPAGVDRIASARALNALEAVALAYPMLRTGGQAAPRLCAAGEAPTGCQLPQDYLAPAPTGLGVENAWCFEGGRGQRVSVFAVERGFNLDHRELAGAQYVGDFRSDNGRAGGVAGDKHHGTAVLGQLVASDDGVGVTGMVPDAQGVGVDYITRMLFIRGASISRAVERILDRANPGDVVNISQGYVGYESPLCPPDNRRCGGVDVEIDPANRRLFRMATEHGIHIVSSAGNSRIDLDDARFNGLFDRNTFDSGSIIVGAIGPSSGSRNGDCSTSDNLPFRGRPAWYSNFGSRVDLSGYGWNVTTTGYGDRHRAAGTPAPTNCAEQPISNEDYTTSFNGTSSAGPTVAGTVAAISSMARAAGVYLDPSCLRDTLARTGIAQTVETERAIGPQPNTSAALAELVKMPAATTPPACAKAPTIECRTGADCLSGLCEVAYGGTRCATTCNADADCPASERCQRAFGGGGGEAGRICVAPLDGAQTACICQLTANAACAGALATDETRREQVVTDPVVKSGSAPDPTLISSAMPIPWDACTQRARPTFTQCVFTPAPLPPRGGCASVGGAGAGNLALALGLLLLFGCRRRR